MNSLKQSTDVLLNLASIQGFLTYDDILNIAEEYELSIPDVDTVTETIQLRGILIYEDTPDSNQIDDLDDYSRVDYEEIFNQAIKLDESMYMIVEAIKNYPPPQYGESMVLIKQIREGNKYARNRLITLYLRSVLKIALSMSRQYEYDLADAFSAGVEGLIFAIERFDPNGFSVFHSYASLWIQQRIHRLCKPKWIEYYYSFHVKTELIQMYKDYIKEMICEDSSPEYELALLEGFSKETDKGSFDNRGIKACASQVFGKMSIEVIEEQDLEYKYFESFVSKETNQYSFVEYADLQRVINQVLSTLSDREGAVVKMRHGIGYSDAMTLEEIGKELNVTRERVRQIEAKAYRKLQLISVAQKLYEFI